MRIIFLGSGRFAMPTLRWLAESDHTVALVVSQPARPSGRGRRIVRTPVQALADDLGLETIAIQDVNEPESARDLLALDARIGLAIDFGQKIGPALLDGWPGGCLNLHGSLLPKYRGAAPINWAIVNGEERTGCTVFRMVEKMDAGPILTSRWTEIKPEETADELHERLAGIGVDTVRATLELFAGGDIPTGTPQNEIDRTNAPKLRKPDGFIDFDQPVDRVANHICGMTSWPGARARFKAHDDRFEDVTVIRARPSETPAKPEIPPGTINANRYIATRDGFLEILEIKPSSGRVMGWSDYVNGRHVAEGDTFVSLRE